MKKRNMRAVMALLLATSMILSACGSTAKKEDPTEGTETEAADAEGYIASPYSIDAELQGPTEYLEPVFYENEDGPTIGVTLVGVIKEDGQYFRDSNNNQKLDVFEDWREDTDTRIADLLTKLNTQQRVGLLVNQMTSTPEISSADEAYDADGKVMLNKLVKLTEDPLNAWVEGDGAPIEGEEVDWENTNDNQRANSTGEMLTYESRSGVVRSTTDATVGALWNNSLNMIAEYAAVAKKEPTVPFMIISNPQHMGGLIDVSDADKGAGVPGSNMGVASAVMGDVKAGGDYSLVERFADLDRQVWDAKGITRMYGEQIDLITDPRWDRNNTTYTEDPEALAGIATALIKGYQTGTDGAQKGDVALIMKHFPGDGAMYNGLDSHNYVGRWRIYQTEGSFEKYQLPGFQAAVDAGVSGIMTSYSADALPGTFGSVAQSYKGVELEAEGKGSAYNDTIINKLLKDTMGFKGFINTDSGVITLGEDYGVEHMTLAEKKAALINVGCDVIGDSWYANDWSDYKDIIESGDLKPEALDRANRNILMVTMNQGLFENPYKDIEKSNNTVAGLTNELSAIGTEMSQKSVVLMKNHDNVLPLKDTAKKVYVASFTERGKNEDAIKEWTTAFETAGFEIVDSEEDADIAFLSVVPGGVTSDNIDFNTIDLVDGLDVPEIAIDENYNIVRTGEEVEATTLMDVDDIADIAETVHENGGIVVASVNISSPWILTNLEPYCDGIIGAFSTAVSSQMDVLTGAYNPTGVLPVTMPSCNEVLEIEDVEVDGVTYMLSVSPNDVPGYDKDQYMEADVLAKSPSGSYAYQDGDGNIYKAWFGLSYK